MQSKADIESFKLEVLKLLLSCDEDEEGWRTARSILNVLDWVMSDRPDDIVMLVVK